MERRRMGYAGAEAEVSSSQGQMQVNRSGGQFKRAKRPELV